MANNAQRRKLSRWAVLRSAMASSVFGPLFKATDLRRPGYFDPTPMFDDPIVSGFRTGGPWPHYDEEGKWCNCVSYQ